MEIKGWGLCVGVSCRGANLAKEGHDGCGLDQNLAERRREFRQFVKFSCARSLATF